VQGKVVARDGSEVALRADTLCIHSDAPGSPQIAAEVAKALREAGVQLRPLKLASR
jgi:lactam utilization protein B